MKYKYDGWNKHYFIYLIISFTCSSCINPPVDDFNVLCGDFRNITCLYGFCNSTNQCECIEPYTTNINSPTVEIQCDYEQKVVKIAFLLEFFLPFGVGHFYAERYEFAVFKLFFFLITVISVILFVRAYYDKSTQETTELIYALNMVMFVPLLIAWQIADIILFGYNTYVDGNGVEFLGWG